MRYYDGLSYPDGRWAVRRAPTTARSNVRAVRHTPGTQAVHPGRNLASLEWVENSDVHLPEIRFISRGNDQLVNACSGSNHSILKQSIWLSVHHPTPLPKARCIHRQYLIRSCKLICPRLDLTRLRWILPAGPLNPCLQFAHRHGRQKQLILSLIVEPSDHSPMRTRLSQFGHDTGVQEVPVHLISSTVRRRSLWRSGIKFSKRASGANNKSLRPGRAAFCKRFHSPIGTRTAVSIPRRVTTWGPFLMVASKNSLNRAFASCTCHEPIPNLLVRDLIIVLSHM